MLTHTNPLKTKETKKLYFCFVDDKGSKIQQNPSRQTQQNNRQKESSCQALTKVLKMNTDDFVYLKCWVENLMLLLPSHRGTSCSPKGVVLSYFRE